MPYPNEARPTTMSSEGLSGRRGAPTGAEVRGVTLVTLVVFLMFLTKIFNKNIFVETPLLINPYKQYNQKPFRLSSMKTKNHRRGEVYRPIRHSNCNPNPALLGCLHARGLGTPTAILAGKVSPTTSWRYG
jgi:hypothetical protein